MRYLILLVLFSTICCQSIKPEEKPATILGKDFTFCGGCGGWIIAVDSGRYRADLLAPFDKENTPVWIRFEEDQRDGTRKNGRWINIISIRNR